MQATRYPVKPAAERADESAERLALRAGVEALQAMRDEIDADIPQVAGATTVALKSLLASTMQRQKTLTTACIRFAKLLGGAAR